MQEEASDLLTARQVQCMFGVDRSTVYRMAEDGRLPALKFGRQWRFPAGPVERLLIVGSVPTEADEATVPGLAPETAAAVVTLAADLLGVMVVATDMQGRPLTRVANPCPWFMARVRDGADLAECIADWKQLADELDFEPQFHIGSLGVECARTYIRSGSSLVGMVIAGGLAPLGSDSDLLYQLDEEQRRHVLTALPAVAGVLSQAIAWSAPPPSPQCDVDPPPRRDWSGRGETSIHTTRPTRRRALVRPGREVRP